MADNENEIVLSIEMGDATSARTAEAYAVGKRGGVDVGSDDPAYHNNAKWYAEQAGGEVTDAEAARDAALAAQGAAEDARDAARTAKTAAETARDTAAGSATAAAGSATAAAGSATAAAGSATDAATAKTAAEASATAAAGSATAAASSATSAASSKTAAASSKTAAANSAMAAAGSATAAAGSATDAAASATAAAGSATAAQAVLDSIPEDYTEMTQDVTALKTAIEELDSSIFVTETTPKAINISSITGIVAETGHNGTASTSAGSVGIRLSALQNYDSYYVVLSEPCDIWFDDSDIISNYLAVLVGREYTRTVEGQGYVLLLASSPVRYRKNDGNLPTENNKLSLNSGDVLAFTVTAGTMSKVHGFLTETTKEVSEEFKDEIIPKTKPTYSIESGKIVINQKKARYEVVHCVDATINQDVWRVYRCGLLDGSGAYHALWDGSDADGVLKLVTDGALESDFVGGYHGDEILTDVKLYIDGNETSISTTASGEFDRLEIWASSNVYHVGGGDLAFERYKVISFDDTNLIIKNNFIAKETVSVAIAHLAMLSVERTIINSYYGNNDYKIMGNTDTVSATPKLDHAFVNTDYGVLDFEYKGDKTLYEGNVTSYQGTGVSNRLKWYFADIYTTSSHPVILNENDTIQGEYVLKIS